MKADLYAASTFLNKFDGKFASWTFQTFDDTDAKRKELISVRGGSIDDHEYELEQLNTRGAGVFVTINAQQDTKKRNKANTTRVRAVFVDLDGTALPESFTLEPSIIVESSAGRYHLYWIVADLPLEEFEGIQRNLAKIFDGDAKVCDLPRVMRLPGFCHQKAEPFLTREIGGNGQTYTRAEILEAYPLPIEIPAPRAEAAPSMPQSDTSAYTRAAVEAECVLVRNAPLHGGNDQINKSAFALGQFVGAGILSENEVFTAIEAAVNTWAKPDLSAKATILSGLAAGKLQPRQVPPSKFETGARAKLVRSTDTPALAAPVAKKKGKATGYNDYRDQYLEHLTSTDTRIAHLEKNNSWWIYDAGVYKQIGEATIKRLVDTALEEHDLSKGTLENVLQKLAHTDSIHRDADELADNELNCANGILDLQTLKLRDHTPEFFSTVQTAAQWDETSFASVWQEFIEFAVPDERDRWVIQQYLGYALTGLTKYQTALFLIGEGRTGKGTIARVATALLGGDAASSYATGVSFEALEDGGHLMPLLVGRRLAVVSELSSSLDWLTFKRITGEDSVQINEKYKTTYSTRLICKLLLLANTMPRLGDDATNSSIVRRLLTVRMNQQPTEPDVTLERRLTAPNELSGILRWAVGGLHSLEQGAGFHTPTGNLNREILEQSNRVITFLEENCFESLGVKKQSRDIYKCYLEWCEQTRHRAISESRFKGDLLSAARVLGWTVIFGRGKSGVVYENLAFKAGLL